MEKDMETVVMGYMGTTIRIHSSSKPNSPLLIPCIVIADIAAAFDVSHSMKPMLTLPAPAGRKFRCGTLHKGIGACKGFKAWNSEGLGALMNLCRLA